MKNNLKKYLSNKKIFTSIILISILLITIFWFIYFNYFNNSFEKRLKYDEKCSVIFKNSMFWGKTYSFYKYSYKLNTCITYVSYEWIYYIYDLIEKELIYDWQKEWFNKKLEEIK